MLASKKTVKAALSDTTYLPACLYPRYVQEYKTQSKNNQKEAITNEYISIKRILLLQSSRRSGIELRGSMKSSGQQNINITHSLARSTLLVVELFCGCCSGLSCDLFSLSKTGSGPTEKERRLAGLGEHRGEHVPLSFNVIAIDDKSWTTNLYFKSS